MEPDHLVHDYVASYFLLPEQLFDHAASFVMVPQNLDYVPYCVLISHPLSVFAVVSLTNQLAFVFYRVQAHIPWPMD